MEPVRIGFVLLSNSRNPAPSTRVAALNMFPFLRASGYDPQILFEPEEATETPALPGLVERATAGGFRLVLFQKVHGAPVEKAVRELAATGIKTVYSVCDLVDLPMTHATDATIVVTDFLKSLYPASVQEAVHVVHDGIEHPEHCKRSLRQTRGSRNDRLRAVLVTSVDLHRLPVVGMPPEWLEVVIVGRYASSEQRLQRIKEARWKFMAQPNAAERIAYLRFLGSRRIRRQAWDPTGVYAAMVDADFGIIPIDTVPSHEESLPPSWKVKSENRLTMKMCMGLPVIATPIPSYEGVLKHGENGFFAQTRSEWIDYLDALRDPAVRQRIGERARSSVVQRYSMEEQARRLLSVLDKLAAPKDRLRGC